MICRAAIIRFFEDFILLEKDIHLAQRTSNNVSTEKLLAEIFNHAVPGTKITLKSRTNNLISSLSTQISSKSLHLIDLMICTPKIKNYFEILEGVGIVNNLKLTQLKSTIFRIAICYFLDNLDDLKGNPSIYYRAMTLPSSENVLENIYNKKFRGSKN